ncbi:hypothetical protein VNO80_07506 [Phaseolus coccineus]|uniref:Uncharacterized protein n=1 Tax=Phaseolus coccineus TaxID=3886 RepID=A0AAN9NK96_PHACN
MPWEEELKSNSTSQSETIPSFEGWIGMDLAVACSRKEQRENGGRGNGVSPSQERCTQHSTRANSSLAYCVVDGLGHFTNTFTPISFSISITINPIVFFITFSLS